MPPLDGTKLACAVVKDGSWLEPTLLLEATAADGKTKVRLCDYGSAGLRGQAYSTWYPMKLPKKRPSAPFTKVDPTRTYFIDELHPTAPAAPADPPLASSARVKLIGSARAPGRRLRLPGACSRAELAAALEAPTGGQLQWLNDEGDWCVS